MSVHVQVYHKSARVLVEIDGELSAAAVEQCLAACDRGQIGGWKEITVVLRNLRRLDANGIELLLYLRERARGCTLRLFDCEPKVAALLAAAGLAPAAQRTTAPALASRAVQTDGAHGEAARPL